MKKSDKACRAIGAASTETEVLAAVRDYLSSLEASEVAVLPAQLMALVLSGAEEVVQSALQLVHTEMLAAHDRPEAALLNQVTLVFSTAAKRLAALAKNTA